MSGARAAWVRATLVPLAVAAVVLRTVVGSGYLIQVDVAFGPRMPPLQWNFYTPVSLVLHIGQMAIGGAAVGRVYALLALAVCGFGAMVLLRDKKWWIQCAGGLLGMLNPFVYDRFVEGQWGVLGATGGLFLFVAAWLTMQRRPTIRTAVATAGSALLVVMSSSNFIGILAVTAIALSLAATHWREPMARRWTLRALLSFGALSAYGIIPFFLNHGIGTYQGVTSFTPGEFAAFQSTPDAHFGLFAALAGLYGDWSERIGRYAVANVEYPWWIASTLVLSGLAVAGALLVRSRAWLLPLGAVGIALSGITATTWGQHAAVTVAQHFPLVAAYREPQKWAVLWLLALVVLGAEAVERVGAVAARRLPRLRAGPMLAALMTVATVAPAGFVELRDTSAVVTPVTYPASWSEGAAYLQAHVPAGSPVAVLPWHQYQTLPFVRHPSGGVADVFFPGNLLTSSDPEIPGTQPSDPIGRAATRPHGCGLAAALSAAGIRWVLVIPLAADGAADEVALQQCGFSVELAPDPYIAVLRGPT